MKIKKKRISCFVNRKNTGQGKGENQNEDRKRQSI